MYITVEVATEALRAGNRKKGGDYSKDGLLTQAFTIRDYFDHDPTPEEEANICKAIELGEFLH